MISVKREGKILEPSANSFDNRSVLNPAIYQDGDRIHLIYRAIDENYMSCLGYARLEGPLEVVERWDRPFLYPQRKEESKGIEDPRICRIDGQFYLTYVVHDGKNAITAYSSGTDLFNLKRGGIISPRVKYRDVKKIFPYSKLKDEYYFFEAYYKEYCGSDILIWHKDCFLFPEKAGGRFVLAHRILPDVQLLYFDDISQLKDKYFWLYNLFNLADGAVLEGEQGFESRHVGGGGPPVKTDQGWIMIYHGVQEFNKKRVYHAGAALLDLENPLKVIARLPYPLFSPSEEFELSGTVSNVVFPSGNAVFGEDLFIYYGAADQYIAAASVKISALLEELIKYKR